MTLEVIGLYAGYDEINVLWDIHLNVEERQQVALVGSNGGGEIDPAEDHRRDIEAQEGSHQI